MEFREYVQRAFIPDLKKNLCNKGKGATRAPTVRSQDGNDIPCLRQLGPVAFTDS
jgi:hypothetical protein